MYVPAEEECGVGAECRGADKCVPGGRQPEFDEWELKRYILAVNFWGGRLVAYHLEEEG